MQGGETKKGTKFRAGWLRSKHLSLDPWDLECGYYWWLEGEFSRKKRRIHKKK